MKRRRYDVAFALGSSCVCTDMLRKAGLQFESFPLDWIGRTDIGRPIGEVMRQRAEMIVNDFDGMLNEKNLEITSPEGNGVHAEVSDRGLGLAFFHDFPSRRGISVAYGDVVEKYSRRIRRFKDRLEGARKVLAYWQADARDVGRISVADIEYCLSILSRRFPNAEFEMLLLEFPCEGQGSEVRRIDGSGYVRIAVDYRIDVGDKTTWLVQEYKILPFLAECFVRDYRSRAERHKWRKKQLHRKMSFFNARNRLEFIWRKLHYNIYTYLRERLERRGVNLEAC